MAYRELYFQKKWFDEASPINPKASSATLTFNGAVVAAETVTIGEKVFEFVAAAVDVAEGTDYAVVVGSTLTADNAVTKLADAINANLTDVVAVKDTTKDTCTITYKTVGTEGNSVTVETDCTKASFGEKVTKLSGGQYGTPCPVVDTIVYTSPYYYWCDVAGNKDDVSWKRFTPASY